MVKIKKAEEITELTESLILKNDGIDDSLIDDINNKIECAAKRYENSITWNSPYPEYMKSFSEKIILQLSCLLKNAGYVVEIIRPNQLIITWKCFGEINKKISMNKGPTTEEAIAILVAYWSKN